MAKYKVIALSVGAMSNKIFSAGEIVDGSAFPSGHAEQLVKDGFLKPIESEQEETPAGDSPTGENVNPETPAPPADLDKELADKAKGAKTPTKK